MTGALRRARVSLRVAAATGPRAALEHRRLALSWWRSYYRFADAVYGEIWADAAAHAGVPMRTRGDGWFELGVAGRSTWAHRATVMLDDVVTARRALERALVHRLLGEHGVPVPAHVLFGPGDLRPALELLAAADGPVVVKPAAGTGGGHGISPAVRTPRQLRAAAGHAARYASTLLAEVQVPGEMYRVLLLDGEPLDVIRRPAPRVTGDGRTTVAGLIARENRRRLAAEGRAGLQLLRPDLDAVATLAASGRGLRTKPAAGEPVVVKTSSSENGDRNEPASASVAPQLLAQCASAAGAAGVRLAGVDVVTADPRAPLDGRSGAVIEVNCGPGLHYHYQVREPALATPVARAILRHVLAAPGG